MKLTKNYAKPAIAHRISCAAQSCVGWRKQLARDVNRRDENLKSPSITVPSQIELYWRHYPIRRMLVNTKIPDFVLNALARDCVYTRLRSNPAVLAGLQPGPGPQQGR